MKTININRPEIHLFLLTVLLLLFCNNQQLLAQDALFIDTTGNVGIGTPSPGAFKLNVNGSLRVNNSVSIGGGDAFQVDDPSRPGGRFIVTSGGNVGIGTPSPGAFKLNVNGSLRVNNSVSIGGGDAFQVDAPNNPGGRFIVTSGGNVGIGTPSPGAFKLNVDGSLRAKDITVEGNAIINNAMIGVFKVHGYDWAGFSHKDLGGAEATFALLQSKDGTATTINIVKNNDTKKVGYIGFNVNNQSKMIILDNGNVGIGINDPKAPLHVRGIEHTYENSPTVWYKGSVKFVSLSSGTRKRTISILADGDIVSEKGFSSLSDIRLKKNIHPTSTSKDLQSLKAIEIVNYTKIDSIADNRKYKKVIAQQLQEVYPIAVQQATRSFIPSVFQASQSIEAISADEYRLAVATDHQLAVNDLVDLKCYPGNSSVTGTVSKIISPTEFVVQSSTSLDSSDYIFVYGKQVDDLLSVDYDAISMLNVSATQELAKQVEILQAKNQTQAKRITELEKQVESLDALKASVAQIQEMMKSETADVTIDSSPKK